MIYGFVTFQRLQLDNYIFPIWSDVIGNVANAIPILAIIIFALYKMYVTFKKKKPFMSVFKSAATWIPLRLKDRVYANMMHISERYTKRDDADNYVWSVDEDQISKAKEKNKEKVIKCF